MPKKDIGYLIKNINDRLKVKADADLKRYHLTLTQSRVLAFLHEKGGQATQKEIELFLEVSHPTVVGLVSRMEQNGHLTTATDQSDKRNKLVSLTPQAHALGKELEQHIQSNEKALLSSLTPEQTGQLKELLQVLAHNLE